MARNRAVGAVVSEEKQGPKSSPGGAGVDSVATELALGGPSCENAKAFLEKQGRLIDFKYEYLADRDQFELSHLRWQRFADARGRSAASANAIVRIDPC